jgi:hypothetical protein
VRGRLGLWRERHHNFKLNKTNVEMTDNKLVKLDESTFDEEITEEDVKRVFNNEKDVVDYTAKILANIINKIKTLKPILNVVGIAKDWTLMQRKIVIYEKQIDKLRRDIEYLKQNGRFNYKFANSEEFVTTNLYLTEGIEKAHSEDQIEYLRKAYIRLLDSDKSELNIKFKYIEIASKITPEHISILGQVIKIIEALEEKDGPQSTRGKGVSVYGALFELNQKRKIFNSEQAAFLIRELEKYNLLECSHIFIDSFRGQIDEQKLSIQFDDDFTYKKLFQDLKKKGWIDYQGKIKDKFIEERDKFINSLDINHKVYGEAILNTMIELNREYEEEIYNLSNFEYIDKRLISNPTGFGRTFYYMVTTEPIDEKK